VHVWSIVRWCGCCWCVVLGLGAGPCAHDLAAGLVNARSVWFLGPLEVTAVPLGALLIGWTVTVARRVYHSLYIKLVS